MLTNTQPPADATRFLQLLDATADKFEFRTFDDDKERSDKTLTRTFYGSLTQHTAKLQQLNDRGAGVFIVVNETDGRGRENENIKRVRAVYADLDGSPLDPILTHSIKPHIIVESSPGKWHCYWRVVGMPLADFTPVKTARRETRCDKYQSLLSSIDAGCWRVPLSKTGRVIPLVLPNHLRRWPGALADCFGRSAVNK